MQPKILPPCGKKSKLQLEVSNYQRRMVELARQEAELKRSVNENRIKDEQLRQEASTMSSSVSIDIVQLETVRKEHTEVLEELRRSRRKSKRHNIIQRHARCRSNFVVKSNP